VFLLGGCGEEEAETTPAAPPATEASRPGAPAKGEPDYAGLGTWWANLPADRRVASAAAFIEENASGCSGVGAADLERQTGIAYGYDFPESAPAAAVMLETCGLLRDGD
jgi:hypothetical protein